MAPLLPILDKSARLSARHFSRSQGRKMGHESQNGHGDGDPSLERLPFLRNRFAVGRQALQVPGDCFIDVPLGFFQGFTLGVTTR